MKRSPEFEAAVLKTDEIHKALIAFIGERFPSAPPLVLMTAAAYLTAGMFAEVVQQSERKMSDHELDVVLDQGIVDTMRLQVRRHLQGLPTRL